MERRPIASRETRWAARTTTAIGRTGITPNGISVLGCLFAIVAGAAFALTGREILPDVLLWVVGAAFVQLRLLANLFDGMVAQERKIFSPVGELYNEVPDRISDTAILVGFGYAVGSNPTLGWLATACALFVAYARAQVAVSGAPQFFLGPMAKPQRMATVTVAALVSIFAPAEWGVPTIALGVIIAGCLVTSIRRLRKGAAHLRSLISPTHRTDGSRNS